jgi:hypothetical protein
MINFREEQINSTNEYCVNQYWEKEIIKNNVKLILYFWRRKQDCPGYWGEEGLIKKVEGIKNNKRKRITSSWILNLGENYCVKQMIAKFN